MAIGNRSLYFLKGDGSVMEWYPGDSEGNPSRETMVITNGAIAIAAGGNHALTLLGDGSVLAWGTDVPEAAKSGVIAIAAGGYFSMALKADGSVLAWGNNESGQTTTPIDLSAASIAAGYSHSLAIVTPVSLQMARSENNLILSWPASAVGFILQSTTNPTDKNLWTPVTTLPVIVDSQNTVTDAISSGAKFYRLKK